VDIKPQRGDISVATVFQPMERIQYTKPESCRNDISVVPQGGIKKTFFADAGGRISSSLASSLVPLCGRRSPRMRERRSISPCWQHNLKLQFGRVGVPADRKEYSTRKTKTSKELNILTCKD
jgi:hypothetical protein